MAKKDKEVKNLDEFHKLRDKEAKGHVHYVCGRKGKKFQSIGITHGKRTKGTNNIPLKKNPDPSDKRPAYARPQLTEKKIENYGKKLNGLGLSQEDKAKVWELIEKLRSEKKKK